MIDARVRVLVIVLLILTLPSAGCHSEPEFAEVEGVVTLNGKPLSNVEVVFLPDPELGTSGPRAASYTDEHGRYRLRCERPEKIGTVIGSHRVCIHDITAIPDPPDLASEDAHSALSTAPAGPPRKSRVPLEYGDVSRTPLRNVTIDSGKQLFNVDLQSHSR